MSMTPWASDTTVTIVCTDRESHPKRRLGEVDEAGIVVTIGGANDKRQPSPKGSGPNTQPERCPKCGRTPRLKREDWQQIVAAKRTAGESSVDISYLP